MGIKAGGSLSSKEIEIVSKQIADGHAFQKHILEKGELAGMGIRTRAQLADFIGETMRQPSDVKALGGGRTAYWNDEYQSVIIHNPKAGDGGTIFQPKNGKLYFDNMR